MTVAEENKETNPTTEKQEQLPTQDESAVQQQQQQHDENELILIQDNAFTIKVHASGLEPFDLQVTSMELVQEINQMLMDKEETCHRTCFSLQLDGQPLDSFSELKTIEGLKDGSVFKVVDEPYNVRQVRLHVRHINDLIHSCDLIDNYNAVNCNSLSFVNELTAQDDNNNTIKPAEYILPANNSNLPLLPLHASAAVQQGKINVDDSVICPSENKKIQKHTKNNTFYKIFKFLTNNKTQKTHKHSNNINKTQQNSNHNPKNNNNNNKINQIMIIRISIV
jgi:hypothetical protein